MKLKTTYLELRTIKTEIEGLAISEPEKPKQILIYGLKNEGVTIGVTHRLNKILAEIERQFSVLDISLKEIAGPESDPVATEQRKELWQQETEIEFEPISLVNIEHIVPKKNYLGEEYDYKLLVEKICQ